MAIQQIALQLYKYSHGMLPTAIQLLFTNNDTVSARIIKNLEKYYHITDAMKKTTLVTNKSRIQYKVLVLVHVCVHNIAPLLFQRLVTAGQCKDKLAEVFQY